MSQGNIPLRIHLFMLMLFLITVLFVMGCMAFWKWDVRGGFFLLTLGGSLSFLFFRRRRLVLIGGVLVWILVLAGMGTVARPTAPGLFLTLASAAGIYFLVRREVKKDPLYMI